MNPLKIVVLLYLVAGMDSCKQSTDAEELEDLEISVEENYQDSSKKETVKNVAGMNSQHSYPKPLCDLLSEQAITSTFPDATDIMKHDVALETPTCMVVFTAMEDTMSMTLTGLPSEQESMYREM